MAKRVYVSLTVPIWFPQDYADEISESEMIAQAESEVQQAIATGAKRDGLHSIEVTDITLDDYLVEGAED